MEKPDVDRIDGISPAIAIRQKNSIRNQRSTVGTTTEIHDYMRLLFAPVVRTFGRNCGKEVVRETAEVVARQLGTLPPGTRLLIGLDLQVVDASITPALAADASEEVDETAEVSDLLSDAAPDSGNATSMPPEPLEPTRAPGAAAVAATIETLRRKGFGRLLVDRASAQAVPFDDVTPAAPGARVGSRGSGGVDVALPVSGAASDSRSDTSAVSSTSSDASAASAGVTDASTTWRAKPISRRVPGGSVPSCRATTSAVSRTTSLPQLRQKVRPTRANSSRM